MDVVNYFLFFMELLANLTNELLSGLCSQTFQVSSVSTECINSTTCSIIFVIYHTI